MKKHITLLVLLMVTPSVALAQDSSIAPISHENTTSIQSSAFLTELQAEMNEEIAANPMIPSQLLMVIAPTVGIDIELAAGVVNVASGSPLEPGAAFRIASVTKTFIAAAVLRQVDLDASIEQYLSPESIALLQSDGYATDRISVRHLLLHTSGIPDFSASNPAYITAVFADPLREWTLTEQLQFALDTADPLGEPGAQYSYSDTGFILLGEVIERRPSQALGTAVRALLNYERLGLTSAYWETQETAPAGISMAHQYFGEVDITTSLSPTIDLYGGGGLVSTTRDLALFYRALLPTAAPMRDLLVGQPFPPQQRAQFAMLTLLCLCHDLTLVRCAERSMLRLRLDFRAELTLVRHAFPFPVLRPQLYTRLC